MLTQKKNKVDRTRRVSADIHLNKFFLLEKDRIVFTKWDGIEFLEKITAYSNEAIGGVAFMEDMKNSLKELMWINGIST